MVHWSSFEVPVGFRFQPTDDELINHYLQEVVNGKLVNPNIIPFYDIYDKNKNPWDTFKKKSKDRDYFYAFTRLKKRSKGRFDRTAGCGTWKGRQSKSYRDKAEFDKWLKKDFIFVPNEGNSGQENGRWIMMELSLPQCDDIVVCRLYNKNAPAMAVGDDDEENTLGPARECGGGPAATTYEEMDEEEVIRDSAAEFLEEQSPFLPATITAPRVTENIIPEHVAFLKPEPEMPISLAQEQEIPSSTTAIASPQPSNWYCTSLFDDLDSSKRKALEDGVDKILSSLLTFPSQTNSFSPTF